MISRESRDKRRDLHRKWNFLKVYANGVDINITYEQSMKARKKEEEIYKKWNFYDGIIKAMDGDVTNV